MAHPMNPQPRFLQQIIGMLPYGRLAAEESQ
jgi:hypothetical protein